MAKKEELIPNPKELDPCRKHPFKGNLWCDDHTDVYVGTKKHLTDFIESQNHPNTTSFKGSAKCCEFLYFVCWSNDSGLNGLLAEIHGGNTILSGDASWEVFATNIDKDDASTRPTHSEINEQILLACKNHAWVSPFVGSENIGENKPFSSVSGVSQKAKFIWHNSKKDRANLWPTAPYVPFKGFDHDEFLIFRVPVSKLFLEVCRHDDCDCCDECTTCHTACSDCAAIEEQELTDRKNQKVFNIAGTSNSRLCASVNTGKPCPTLDIPKIQPCFYLHWGDSTTDKIETHDTEIVYITVCNPYNNIAFKGITILNIELLPVPSVLPNGEPSIRIAPSKLIGFDCLDACTCTSREFALITRNAKAQNYTLNVEYCIDEILIKGQNKGKTSFQIKLSNS